MGERHTGFLSPASQPPQGSAPPKPVCFPRQSVFFYGELPLAFTHLCVLP